MTLRLRLVLLVAGLLVIVLGGLGAYVAASLDAWASEVLDDELAHRAAVIAGEVKWEHGELEVEDDEANVGAQGWSWRLESADGAVLASTRWPRIDPRGLAAFETVGGERVHTHHFIPRHGGERLVLRLAAPQATFSELARRVRTGVVVALLLALVLGALGAAAVAQVSLAPLRRLSSEVSRIEATSLATRLDEGGLAAELHGLAQAFNGVLGRLERAFDAQRAFVARASHALRTPLASILTRAEVTLRRDRSPDEYRAALQEIAGSADASTALANGLLALSRADADTAAEQETVSLAELALALEHGFRARAEEAGVSIATSVEQGLGVTAGRGRLRELCDVLLDNALRYTPRGGSVTFEGRTDGGEVVLSVRDTGPGFAPDEREKVLEPFFRGRAAQGKPGSGLGLAVARSLAEAEGGTLQLGDAPGGGALVTARLPRRWPQA